jgi:hypothetical protein
MNVAYAMRTKNLNAEELEQFEESIGMKADPAQLAREALAAHQAATGMHIEDPDRPIGPDAKAIAAMDEKELGAWMGGPRG